MTISPKRVYFDDKTMRVELEDGQLIVALLKDYPRLFTATAEQRAQVELSPCGLHWDALDEDLSIEGLLAGKPQFNPTATQVAHPLLNSAVHRLT